MLFFLKIKYWEIVCSKLDAINIPGTMAVVGLRDTDMELILLINQMIP